MAGLEAYAAIVSTGAGRKVFTLLVEMRCNSYCVFCGSRQVDEGVVRARARVGLSTPLTAHGALRGRYTLESATAELQKARDQGYTDLSLQGGEPTLWADLVALVREARRIGFDFIGVVTNGRKLADREFATALMGAGLDGITASLVGWNAETHDATALAPGAFDELMIGLRNVTEASVEAGRKVTVNVNVITSARTVDHLAEQVRLLADAHVQAAAVHLVRYHSLGSDPTVRETLRFDIRRIVPALARGKAEAKRLGISLHAGDVPMCLHPGLDAGELGVLRHRATVNEHQFRGAAFGFDGMPAHQQPELAACHGCLLAKACPRVPPEYLPVDPAAALRAITPESVARAIDDVLASVDPSLPDAGARVGDLSRAIAALRWFAPDDPGLSEVAARIDRALLDLTCLAHEKGQSAVISDAFWCYLGLKPPQWDIGEVAILAPAWPASTLARRTGGVPPGRAGAGPRLRFGTFDVALTGVPIGQRELELTAARPVLRPVGNRVDRICRAIFAACVCAPLRGAARLRLADDRVSVDSGSGYRTVFTFTRPGAITLHLP